MVRKEQRNRERGATGQGCADAFSSVSVQSSFVPKDALASPRSCNDGSYYGTASVHLSWINGLMEGDLLSLNKWPFNHHVSVHDVCGATTASHFLLSLVCWDELQQSMSTSLNVASLISLF